MEALSQASCALKRVFMAELSSIHRVLRLQPSCTLRGSSEVLPPYTSLSMTLVLSEFKIDHPLNAQARCNEQTCLSPYDERCHSLDPSFVAGQWRRRPI